VQRIRNGEEGIAPFMSFIQIVAEAAQNAISEHRSRDELVGSMSALQMDSNETLHVSQTYVETFFHMNEQTDESRLTNSMSWLNLLLVSIAFVAFLAFGTGIIGAIQIFFDNVRKRSSNTVQLAYWGIFMLMSSFVVLTSAETSVWNRCLMALGQAVWGSSDSANIESVFGMQTSAGTSTGTESGTTLNLEQTTFVLDDTEPVFCDTTFVAGNDTYNRYPRGTAVYEYNRRRLAGTNVLDYPELQYIQSLLDDPNYPPVAGGITTTMARAFGGISNECDEFNGDVTKCCDETNCQLAADPSLCIQQRCPGKVMSDRGGGQHCRCAEITSKLGLQVEFKQLSLCGTQAQNWLKNNLAQVQAAQVRQASSVLMGCSGNYDASLATITGPASLQVYSMSSFSDKGAWGASSLYVQLNSGGDPTAVRVSLPLSNCATGTKTHYFRLRYLNFLSTTVTMSVYFDDVPAGTITFPGGKSTTVLSTDVTFRIPGVIPGDHMLSLSGNAGGFPVIHRFVVCTDSDTYCAEVLS